MDGIITGAIGGFLDGMARNVWTGTLELLRNVLGLVGTLGRVDPTPGAGAISTTLWSSMLQLAAIIAAILFFTQLAMAVLNPRRHMLTAALGPVQYGIATVLTVTIVVALLGAADGLTSLIFQSGANVTDAAATMDRLGLTDDNNAVKAPVLAVLGIVAVLPLSIGYGVMLLFRSASILVIFATIPVLSAGLVNLATKHWFWRGLRWLLALIFIQPTFALCFTIGSGVISAAGRGQGDIPTGAGTGLVQNAPTQGSGIVTLLLGFGILFVALFAPMALFRLFAFVEPGTQPHQTMMSAFGSAAAGFKQAGAGIASADVGSVFSSATGGRFGGSQDAASSSGGGTGGGSDDKKQLAATAAAAAATGGASAAVAGAGAGGAGTGGASAAGGQALPAVAGQGQGSSEEKDPGDQEELVGAGAAASSPGQLGGAGAGAGASGGSGGGSSAGGSSGSAGGSAGSAGGASGSSSGSGGGASGSGSSGGSGGAAPGSLAGHWAAAQGSAIGGGRVAALGAAAGTVGRGAWSAGVGIAGAAPMPPAPQGGVAGRVGDYGPADYAGGLPPRGNPYRDPSYDRPDEDYADFDDQPDRDEPDDHRMSGVL
ncbi:hypothetical protein [Actinomycetospora soli]|uniref:hypothetical protein n=1 Tax=Actinomycetospora soli TaxID=2893887 RepID=UPI001E4E0DF9|nr:hypothetical protein [Actinomycetospora soli]MCD2191594.1 hypothetical protein [Actinomycetospora soli]